MNSGANVRLILIQQILCLLVFATISRRIVYFHSLVVLIGHTFGPLFSFYTNSDTLTFTLVSVYFKTKFFKFILLFHWTIRLMIFCTRYRDTNYDKKTHIACCLHHDNSTMTVTECEPEFNVNLNRIHFVNSWQIKKITKERKSKNDTFFLRSHTTLVHCFYVSFVIIEMATQIPTPIAKAYTYDAHSIIHTVAMHTESVCSQARQRQTQHHYRLLSNGRRWWWMRVRKRAHDVWWWLRV